MKKTERKRFEKEESRLRKENKELKDRVKMLEDEVEKWIERYGGAEEMNRKLIKMINLYSKM